MFSIIDILLFLAGVFLIVFLIGDLLEKIRIPAIFSALLIGLGLAVSNPFKSITSSESFTFLAELGMYFLLFIIGLELDFKKIARSSKFIFKATAVIIFSEAITGSLFVHYILGVGWLVSFLLATSFATVGEAVLLPILDEFKLTRTKLGQTILSIGVLDDIIEILTLVGISLILSETIGIVQVSITSGLSILAALFFITLLFMHFGKQFKRFNNLNLSLIFTFLSFLLFLFSGLGNFVESAALGALFAGIASKQILSDRVLKFVESYMRIITYGFFAPLFFLWVGVDVDVFYLLKYPLLILFFMIVINGAKVISSYIMGRKIMGAKKSIIMGASLSVKFSTSIVILKLLFEYNLIPVEVYSIFIGTKIVFMFIIPFLLSYLIKKWYVSPLTSKN